ncbi:MAG: hypothetical protein HXX15_05860 [Rhodopseudomonas sp.]|uniref:hypothetical protein n=1 Tax=Rhodopseudomonas sp. TaxID=1078 RepID=UPI0017E4D8C0|nr:hypothetical protein [Rhodopseudomonas sp.]NVN85598.1 hypothetical protein [Rhodopseudomonas sp.]
MSKMDTVFPIAAFSPPNPDQICSLYTPHACEPRRLLGLLAELYGQTLQTVFTAIDLIESILDRNERTLRGSPDAPELRQDRMRIAAELSAARMTAVRLSTNLAKVKRVCSLLDRDGDPAPRFATAANVERLIQRSFTVLLQ